MGISASKRAKSSLSHSDAFDSACNSAFSHCLSLTQHAFEGVFPYQLPTASDHLHKTLHTLHPHPLIVRWVPSPPNRSRVDSALKFVTRSKQQHQQQTLGPDDFKQWALELFGRAIVENAGKAVMWRVPIGVAGIGAATRSGKDLVRTALGVYALGVATSIFMSLSG